MSWIEIWAMMQVIPMIIAWVLICIFFLTIIVLHMNTAYVQWRCKHTDGVNETQACDAICRKCGKNLGFIGSYRERMKR